ncbi:MAG TPA: SRPBCC family protein [Turneriella sp.]|nr:SRPBCC family protein [Turneriella sp.]HMY10735.1 SRPBCC family protein [Turneriella sp.]HNA78620.1 SRPBCC family protein [Turneriella sp.]HNE18668.1 SRPBCC family protein [Turneriella sp.]HNL10531.1 SRPBCC family protein [Turneriella sp.]
MDKTKITIEAQVAAPVKKVWDYYNQPQHIIRWNFAHESWQCPSAENDLRPGGKLKSRMEARDGSFGFDFEATYDEVADLKRIVYTIADGRRVETDFTDVEGNTRIVTVFEAESQNPVEMQKGGWQAILDNFKKYTEAN